MKNLGLRAKLLWLTVVMSIVPLLLLGLLSYYVSQSVLHDVSERQSRVILEKERRLVQTVMGDVESLMANVSGQDALKEFLERPFAAMGDYDKLTTQARIGYILSGYINLKGLVSIDVFAPGGASFHVGDTLDQGETRHELVARLRSQAQTATSVVHWSGVEDNVNSRSSYRKVITAVKRLAARGSQPNSDSLLVVSYDPAVLNRGNDASTGDFSIILDSLNRIVIHPNPDLWGKVAPDDLVAMASQTHASFSYVLDGKEFDAHALPLEKGGWTLFHLGSVDGLRAGSFAIALGLILSLLVAVVLVALMSRLIGFEVAASREKDSLLIQQSRQASMGEMIGNIAHQWRQPLNTAALLVQELQFDYEDGRVDPAAMQAFSSQMLGVIDKMSTTIDDFRDFFQPNRAEVVFSVEEAVLTSLSFVEPAFKSHSIRLEVHRNEPGFLRGHSNEFSQVFLNVLNNAKDVLTEKSPSEPSTAERLVVVKMATVGDRQIISITDSGGGIPAEVLPKIFDPYFTTKGPSLGTGIGLFMSKTIIERNMGGRLLVCNATLGSATGAEFTLDLPTADQTATQSPQRPQA